jgi:hypothetical protein
MSTPYEIDITMSTETVNALNKGPNPYQLYGFKAVQTSASGAPLVWFATHTFGTSTAVKWSEQYQAYTTVASAISGGSVTASNPVNMNLGWTLDVNTSAGTGTIVTTGTSEAITIANQSGVQFTAGISETVVNADGTTSSNPLCAFDLYGTTTLQIAPIEQVLLMFATASYNTGTVVENAFTTGILINLTQSNTRSVNFDINAGWSSVPAGSAWASPVQNGAALAPLLIDTPAANATVTLLRGAGGGIRRMRLVA